MRRRTFLQYVIGFLVAPWLPKSKATSNPDKRYTKIEIQDVGNAHFGACKCLANGQTRQTAGRFYCDGEPVFLDLGFVPDFVLVCIETENEDILHNINYGDISRNYRYVAPKAKDTKHWLRYEIPKS